MLGSRRARPWIVWSLGGCLVVACNDKPVDGTPAAGEGGSTPTGETPAKGDPLASTWPDDPIPAMRTGTRAPKALDALEGTIVARRIAGAEYLELELPRPSGEAELGSRIHVEGLDHAVAVLDETIRTGPVRVLIRVPTPSAVVPAEIKGTLYVTVFDGGKQVGAAPFVAKGPVAKADDSDLETRFFTVLSTSLFDDGSWWLRRQARHPWHSFASARVHPASRKLRSGGPVVPRPARPSTDFAQLMYTTTAATSIQEALQYDRGMGVAIDAGAPTLPIAELTAPSLVEHPFETMLAALPDPKAGEPEPLAAATPAEFWYVRFDDIRVFLRVLDEADTWITPVTHVFEERAEVHDLATRYQRQLGLRRTGLAKALGHTVIERMAVVGSDPYFREGSDVTFVFDVAAQSVFDNELTTHLDAYRAEVPGIAATTITHGAHTIAVNRDPDGLVRQYRAQAGDLALVSNSEGACKAVLDAIDGKRAKLSDQKDLAYMLARDPGKHEGFVFLGDRFIASVVGPAQKVQESRRQRALAELLTPGYAALLYGWLEGKPPADTDTLVTSKLLDKDELKHSDGSEIVFTPGKAARSSWGRPDDLTPLIDLPPVDKVTEQEKAAYATFTRGYQDYWRNFMDPVAVRLDIADEGGVERAIVDVRVLPLISGTEYSDIEEIVGQERIEVPSIDDGVQMVWAVGADSEMRRELDRAASGFSGKKDIGIGWLGDWVMVGALDRTSVVELAGYFDDRAQMPRVEGPDREAEQLEIAKRVGKLPVFAAAHVRNPAALIATLTAVRGMVNEVAPGWVDWGEHSKYEDIPIVRVGVTKAAPEEYGKLADAIALYYAQAGNSIIFALDPKVLEALIHRMTHDQGPKRGTGEAPQFFVEAQLDQGKPAWTALLWMMQGQANASQSSARASAEILLRGDPSVAGDAAKLTALGLAYFGSYPVSASGKAEFTLRPDGVADPVHGSELLPVFPALPVEGSPIAALMARLQGLRATVAFDREPAKMEPPARSLHTHFELTLGAASD
jgi:hypothetical protein